jgi:hypothetical protein
MDNFGEKFNEISNNIFVDVYKKLKYLNKISIIY